MESLTGKGPESDIRQLAKFISVWCKKNSHSGTVFRLEPKGLLEAADEIFLLLQLFPDANAVKRAAIILYAFSQHHPVWIDVSAGSEVDENEIEISNFTAAYRFAMVHVVNKMHYPKNAPPFFFSKEPEFPSVHSFMDFAMGLLRLKDQTLNFEFMHEPPCSLPQPHSPNEKCPDRKTAYQDKYIQTATFIVTRISLIIELNLYRANPEVAAITDRNFYREIQHGDYGPASAWTANIQRSVGPRVFGAASAS